MQRSTKKFGLQPRFVIFKITLRISLYIPLLRGNSQNQPSTERKRKQENDEEDHGKSCSCSGQL